VSEEIYVASPLGVLTTVLGVEEARRAIDALELHMRRHYGETPGIVLDCSELRFVELAKVSADWL